MAPIPPQAWIVLMLALTAIGPASYVWRHFSHGLTPRDITLPPEDLGWKSGRQLAHSLAVLAGLASVAVFVFTQAAVDFVHSDWFVPSLFGSVGSFALSTLVSGWRKGEIEPLLKGLSRRYAQSGQPKRYWLSMLWNGVLGAALVAMSVWTFIEQATPKCDDDGDRAALIEALSRCDTLLANNGLDVTLRADLLADRGRVHHRLGNDRAAVADYSDALALDPSDSYSFYNRALVYSHLGNLQAAQDDLDTSLALRPGNAEAHQKRGLINLNRGRFDEAIKDFTRVDELDPKDPFALANRGLAHAWQGNGKSAERDFQAISTGDEGWPIVLHGRAVLAFKQEDYPRTIGYLSQAIAIDPEDYFALRMRADAYWAINETDLARDDDDRSMALERRKAASLDIRSRSAQTGK